MVVNRNKKIRKLRGSRTHGWGSPKKHRGKGSRGGKGNAGSGKKGQQKMSKLHNLGKRIGKDGFNRPRKMIKNDKVINLNKIDSKINEFLEDKTAMKKSGKIEIDISKLGYTKVLGTGKIDKELILKCKGFSKKAEEKVKKAGGECIKI